MEPRACAELTAPAAKRLQKSLSTHIPPPPPLSGGFFSSLKRRLWALRACSDFCLGMIAGLAGQSGDPLLHKSLSATDIPHPRSFPSLPSPIAGLPAPHCTTAGGCPLSPNSRISPAERPRLTPELEEHTRREATWAQT